MNPIPQLELAFTPGSYKQQLDSIMRIVLEIIPQDNEEQTLTKQQVSKAAQAGDAVLAAQSISKLKKEDAKEISHDLHGVMIETLKVEDIVLNSMGKVSKSLHEFHQDLQKIHTPESENFNKQFNEFKNAIEFLLGKAEKEEAYETQELQSLSRGQAIDPQQFQIVTDIPTEIAERANDLENKINEFNQMQQRMNEVAHQLSHFVSLPEPKQKEISDSNRKFRPQELKVTLKRLEENFIGVLSKYFKLLQSIFNNIIQMINFEIILIYRIFNEDVSEFVKIINDLLQKGLSGHEASQVKKSRQKLIHSVRKESGMGSRVLRLLLRKTRGTKRRVDKS